MANPIKLNSIAPNTTVMIRGKVSFSRIASLIQGDELTRDIQEQSKRTQYPITSPYCKLSLCEARVVYQDQAAATDPSRKTAIEQWAENEMYVSTKNPQKYPGMNYNAVMTKRLPWLGVLDGTTVQQVTPEGELANGMDVTIVLRVYKSKNYANHGVSFDGIICNEPVRYFQQVNLSAYGLTFKPEVRTVPADEADAASGDEGYQSNPFSAAPAAETPAEAPAPAGQFPAAPAPAAPAPGAPVAPAAPAGGIQYTPDGDPNRQY